MRTLALRGATPLEGGIPLIADGKLIGAIGVSGATSVQDGQVAKAGADVAKSTSRFCCWRTRERAIAAPSAAIMGTAAAHNLAIRPPRQRAREACQEFGGRAPSRSTPRGTSRMAGADPGCSDKINLLRFF